MFVEKQYKQFKIISTTIFLLSLVSNLGGQTSVKALTVSPQQINCANILDGRNDFEVTTAIGLRVPAGKYCKDLKVAAEDRQANAWGESYRMGNNICRDRDADTVCLTPQGAANLRWSIPFK